MKRFKELVLVATSLLLLCLSIQVSAATETYTEDEQLAIDKLAVTKVMIGTDNGFEGKSNLTRAQAAAIMVRVKGISEENVEAERKKGTTVFKDVKKDHWALGYINVAQAYGLVKGVSATEFNPEAKVTIGELVTMAARSLNAGNMVDNYTESWPDNYMRFAQEEKLLTGITHGKSVAATRCETALIVSKTLEADVWKVSGVTTTATGTKNSYSRQKGESLLKGMFNIERYVDETVDTVSKTKKTATFGKNADGKKSEVPTTDVDSDVDLTKVSSKDNVEVWYNTKTKKIVLLTKVEKGKSNVGKEYDFGFITKYTSSSGKITFNIDGKSVTYYISNSADDKEIATYNGKKKTKKELDELLNKSSTNLRELTGLVEVTGTDIDHIDLVDYSNIGVVSSVTSSKINFYDKDTVIGTTADSKLEADDDDMIVVNLSGDKLDRDAIKKGFVVKYYYDSVNKIYRVMTYSKNEKGNVDSRSSSEIEIDDETYKVDFIGSYTKPATGKNIKLYLNNADDVIMYTVDSTLYKYSEADEDDADDDDDDEVDATYGVITRAYTSGSKCYISINGGTKKEVNLEETLDMFDKYFDDEDDLADYIEDELLATYCQYEIKSSKYILYQFGEYCDGSVDDLCINPTSTQKLDKTNKKIGSYTYKSPTVYECVYDGDDTVTKRKISLSDLDSGSKYYVGLFTNGTNVTEIAVYTTTSFVDEPTTPVTPVTPTPTTTTELRGVVSDVKETIIKKTGKVDEHYLTIDVITKAGKDTLKYVNAMTEEQLPIGSYVEFKRDSTTKTNITDLTVHKVEDIDVIECKVYELKTECILVREPGENGIQTYTNNGAYYVKAGTLTKTDDKFEVGSLSLGSQQTLIGPQEDYATKGTTVYLYKVSDKIAVILYK